MLSYRLPREPSSPRVALWRRLKRLGVAQISDGLVVLPADARTREQLEWAADDVVERGGVASVWLAQPATRTQERELATAMAADRAAEYLELEAAARRALDAPPAEQHQVLMKLRRAIRAVHRRDFFPPTERDRAQAALRLLAERAERAERAEQAEQAEQAERVERAGPVAGVPAAGSAEAGRGAR
ncbi:hypothetical protein C8K30_108145 [Promicromonospora sp. AC04]|nr:hypothetical protein C8K30_108145 [Promicromonospora sp. AC04]